MPSYLIRADLEEYSSNHLGFYGLEIDRISSILIAQVIQMDARRVINTHIMLDVIKMIEGGCRLGLKKKFDTFKNPPLKGLKKAHFTDPSFLLRNLGSHFGYENGGNKKLEKVIEKAFKSNISSEVDEAFINYIAHYTTIGALAERWKSGRMTGEWIVFQEFERKYYYLTLASHAEDDDNIYRRVNDAYDLNFPFLRDNA